MKKRILSMLLATMLLVGVLAGCESGNTGNTGNTGITDTTTVNNDTTTETVTTTAPQVNYTGVYDDLLFEIYQHILSITYDPEKAEDYEGTMGIREVVGTLREADALKAIGFIVDDINADSVPELLIYLIDDNGNEKCAGTRILAAFTYDGTAPALILEGSSRNRYYLLYDGLIYNENPSGAAYSIFGTYTLPASSTEIKAKDYYFTAPDENDPETILFYHNETGDFDIEKSELFDGPENNFWQIQLDLSLTIAETELTPFEVFSAGPDDGDTEVSYVYATLIDHTDADLTNALRFTADNSDYETEVVFHAIGDIYDFAFCEVSNIDYSDSGEFTYELVPKYTTDALTEDSPLVVTMTFWGDIPSYGITYTDSEGTAHSALISLSGEDGSVVLNTQ